MKIESLDELSKEARREDVHESISHGYRIQSAVIVCCKGKDFPIFTPLLPHTDNNRRYKMQLISCNSIIPWRIVTWRHREKPECHPLMDRIDWIADKRSETWYYSSHSPSYTVQAATWPIKSTSNNNWRSLLYVIFRSDSTHWATWENPHWKITKRNLVWNSFPSPDKILAKQISRIEFEPLHTLSLIHHTKQHECDCTSIGPPIHP